MSTLPVIVYGNGDLFKEYFDAIVSAFGKGNGSSHFKQLLHIATLLAGVTAIYSFILRRDLMQMVKWLGLFYLAIYMLFIPESTIIIIDRVNGNASYFVDHVPRGLAVLSSYTSAIGDALTQDLESNFTMPDYQPYHRTGMVFASRMVEAVSQFEITDANFDTNLKEFIHQCIFYDILLKKYSINDLVSAGNVWSFVANAASPARAFIYNSDVITCKEGATKLTSDWKQIIESTAQLYGKRFYPNEVKEKAKTDFLKNLPISYQYLTKLSATASDILQQNLMANAIQRGIVSMGAKLNAPAALESYSFARAQEQKRLTNKTIGDMAAYWLPLMKNAFEVIMYGSFIFIVLLSLFPFGWMVLKNYVYTLLWIQIWAPLYAIINLIVSYYAQSNTSAAIDGGLSLANMSGVLQINADMAGLAGYLTLLVPFLSAGLVKGMSSAFSHLSQSINGVMQSAGGGAASEAVTGNMGFGNTSFGNHNAFNTQANHVDTSGRLSAGSFTTQLPGGSSLTFTPDGTAIMDMRNSISNLGASVNLAESIRASYAQQAERYNSAVSSNANSYSHSKSGELRNMYELGSHLNKLKASGYSWATSENAATGSAINENIRLTKDFANKHHMSFDDASNLLSSAYTESKLSGSVGLPGGLPISASLSGSVGHSETSGHNVSTSRGSLYSEAKDFIRDTNYAKNIDSVERAVKDHTFRLNDEEGKRLVDSMGASMSSAESARHDMQSNFSKAETARSMASLATEKAESINVNASQHFMEWLADQPGTNGHGRLGYRGAEAMKNDPAMMQSYAHKYVEQERSHIEASWNHGIAHTESQIKNRFHANNHQVKTDLSADKYYQTQHSTISASAKQEGLIPNQIVDPSPVNQTEKMLYDNKVKIEQEKQKLAMSGEQEMKIAKDNQSKK